MRRLLTIPQLDTNHKLSLTSLLALIIIPITVFLLIPTKTKIGLQASTPTAAPFRFISWSDTQEGLNIFSNLSNQASLLNPNFTIFSGDVENGGFTITGSTNWKNANALFDKTFPVRGNHDTQNTAGWQSFYDLVRVAGNVVVTNYTIMPGKENLTYSFDYLNSHFVGLDVGGDASFINQLMLDWLDSDLTSAENRGLEHAFIFFHGPIYCVDGHCDSSCVTRVCPLAATVGNLIDVLNLHSIVTATFHGHEHVYTSTYIDSSRISFVTRPFYQFVTGNAGAGPASCDKTYRYDYCSYDYGFLVIDVSGLTVNLSWYKTGSNVPIKTLSFTKILEARPTPTPTSIPTEEIKTVEFLVSNGSDDAYQQSKTVYLTGSQIKMGWYDPVVGFRVIGSGLKDLKGKIVTEVALNLTPASTTRNNITQRIYLQASDSCSTFTSADNNIASRPTTSNSVLWNIGVIRWDINTRYASPNFSTAVSEVINRPNWDGNSLCVILKNENSAKYAERYIYAKETGQKPVSLKITYGSLIGSSPTPTLTPTLTPTPTVVTPTPTPIPTPTSGGEQKIVEFFVSGNSGDAFQQGRTMFISGTQIKMGWYDNGVGFKITGSGLAVLKGKIIDNASLNVTSALNTAGNIVQRIYLQASNTCSDFSSVANDITNRPTTVNSVLWNIGTSPWVVKNRYSSPEMALLVSEVIQRPSWDGASLCVILKEAGSVNYNERYIYAKENGLYSASLKITYH